MLLVILKMEEHQRRERRRVRKTRATRKTIIAILAINTQLAILRAVTSATNIAPPTTTTTTIGIVVATLLAALHDARDELFAEASCASRLSYDLY